MGRCDGRAPGERGGAVSVSTRCRTPIRRRHHMATDNATTAGNDAIFSLEQMRGAYEHRRAVASLPAGRRPSRTGETTLFTQAIRKCGLYHADVRFAPFTSMDDFDVRCSSRSRRRASSRWKNHREGRGHAVNRLPLLPVVEAWKTRPSAGRDPRCATLVTGRRPRASSRGSAVWKFDLLKTIANGDDVCQIRITRK